MPKDPIPTSRIRRSATVGRLAKRGEFRPGERVVALITGHGLKTREVLDGRAGATITVRPNIDALTEALAPVRPGLAVAGQGTNVPH